MTLRDYILRNCDAPTHAGGVWQGDYLGDGAAWDALLARYSPVMQFVNGGASETERERKNFGVAGAYSGAFWHRHGPALSHTLTGRKAWFLYPRGITPPGQWTDAPSVDWYHTVFPRLSIGERPMTCELGAGDVMFVPEGWYHSTVNLAPYTAFMTVFG